MKSKSLFLFLLICLLAACSGGKNAGAEKIIVLQTVEGRSVFDLLIAEHQADFSMSEMGVFIKSIDGIKNENGHYWLLYINGKPAQSACDRIIANQGDIIEWRYK